MTLRKLSFWRSLFNARTCLLTFVFLFSFRCFASKSIEAIHQEILSRVSSSDQVSLQILQTQIWWRNFFNESESHLSDLKACEGVLKTLHQSLEAGDRLDGLDWIDGRHLPTSNEDTEDEKKEEDRDHLKKDLALCEQLQFTAYRKVLMDWTVYLEQIRLWQAGQHCPPTKGERFVHEIYYSFFESRKEAGDRAFQTFNNFKAEYEKIDHKDMSSTSLSAFEFIQEYF